jgi:hypothetical protein
MSLYMPRRHIEEVEVQLHSRLTSTTDGGELSTWRPGRFNFSERWPDTHGIGDSLDALEKGKMSYSCWDSNHGSSSPLDSHYTAWVIPRTVTSTCLLKITYSRSNSTKCPASCASWYHKSGESTKRVRVYRCVSVTRATEVPVCLLT